MEHQQRHVFVDASGRRQAWLRRSGWTLSALVAGYLLVLVIALVAPPGFSRLAVPGLRGVLPDAGAPRLGDGSGGDGSPQDVLEGPASPRPGSRSSPSPGATGGAAPTGTPPAVAPGSSLSPTPLTAPPTGQGRPTRTPAPAATATTPPGNRPSTPPGKASPTASPTATAKSTGKPTARPSRTPRA